MKKTIIFLFLFISSFSFAKYINESQAKLVGKYFLISKMGSSQDKNSLELQLSYKARSTNGTTCFYVFNIQNKSGFVIVSADDNITPVLGYSNEFNFNSQNLPTSVFNWIEGYSKQVSYIITHHLEPDSKIKNQWSILLAGEIDNKSAKKTASVSPLLQTTWNQHPYYNALCPYDNTENDNAVTGCVATAMAQVMKYWNHPVRGTGSHSYEAETFGPLSADFSSTTYAWDSMPNNLSEHNSAVATLMYQCGVSVDMHYSVSGSGSFVISAASPSTNCAEYALKTYFGYKSSIEGIQRFDYTDDDWKNILKTELDSSRPVIYAGFDTSAGGHAYVADGYDVNDYFHINWGWGGSYNGYFIIDNLNPGSYAFNNGHQALIKVEPSDIINFSDIHLSAAMTVTPLYVTEGDAISVNSDIINSTGNSFNGDLSLSICDLDNNPLFTIEEKDNINICPGCNIPGGLTFYNSNLSISPGDYKLILRYRSVGGDWNILNQASFQNPLDLKVYMPADAYENNNSLSNEYFFNLSSGNSVNINSSGSNINIPLDIDHYGVSLPIGYNYTITGNLFDSENSAYSLDASLYYSIDNGPMWPVVLNNFVTNGFNIDGGQVIHFKVNSKNIDNVGTYFLDLNITRNSTILGIANNIVDEILLYPNPAKDYLIVKSSSNGNLNKIVLSDIEGRSILSSIVSQEEIRLPLTNLEDGLYFIHVYTDKGMVSRKVLINR